MSLLPAATDSSLPELSYLNAMNVLLNAVQYGKASYFGIKEQLRTILFATGSSTIAVFSIDCNGCQHSDLVASYV
jgi:hypothetical protein